MPVTRDDALATTLGQRLDALGRDIAMRHLITYPWAGHLAYLLGRTAQLTELFQGRFERDESPATRPLVTTHWAPGHAAGPAPAGARPPSTGAPAEPAEPGRPLPFDVRSRLREVAGPGADALRVHTGAGADTFARSHGAEAVTQGTDVYLRDGRYSPDDPGGLGLLAHEAAHVTALLDPGQAARRAAAPGAEEDAALSSERAARMLIGPAGSGLLAAGPDAPRPLAGPVASLRRTASTPGPPQPAQPEAGPAASAAAAARPMRAAEDRDTGQSASLDVEELRRGIITELMRQLRTEFERGG